MSDKPQQNHGIQTKSQGMRSIFVSFGEKCVCIGLLGADGPQQ